MASADHPSPNYDHKVNTGTGSHYASFSIGNGYKPVTEAPKYRPQYPAQNTYEQPKPTTEAPKYEEPKTEAPKYEPYQPTQSPAQYRPQYPVQEHPTPHYQEHPTSQYHPAPQYQEHPVHNCYGHSKHCKQPEPTDEIIKVRQP